MAGDIAVITQGPSGSYLLASWRVPAGAPSHHSSYSALGAQMKSVKCTWRSDMQERLMRLAPVKMLEEKRV